MNLTPEQMAIGKENFNAAIGSGVKGPNDEPGRREFLNQRIQEGLAANDVPGYAYFGYESSVGEGGPVRVGVIGTGDEGSVLIGAINPDFIEVRSIADIRPYNVYRAFHGDHYSGTAQKVRPGLMKKYGWKTRAEADEKVKVYGPYEELIANAQTDGIEAVIIALPLHLHAPAAIAAMRAGLHVLTEKLMGHSVRQCKEMARVAEETNLHLATGHQRHYNIFYDNAVDLMRRGLLGDLHYIRAQWHRGNLPGSDSWQQPLPKEAKPLDPKAEDLLVKLAAWKEELAKAKGGNIAKWQRRIDQVNAQITDKVLAEKGADGKTGAERFGYEDRTTDDYNRPAIEELIRWRLWDRTGGGLMAELGSHQLDAASIFISAMHGGVKQHPLNVSAAANRPLFPADRDVDDHVYCLFEFPAPGYDADDPYSLLKRIGVQYASINGNGFGGYGETVLGTKGTLLLERESEAMLFRTSKITDRVRVVQQKKKVKDEATGKEVEIRWPELSIVDPEKKQKPDAQSISIGQMATKDAGRGYQQQLEHWAWCIRKNPENQDPEVQPRCHPKVAMGDAVIALTTNIAARRAQRIEFKKEWFDPDDDATPENPDNKPELKPDPSRYGA